MYIYIYIVLPFGSSDSIFPNRTAGRVLRPKTIRSMGSKASSVLFSSRRGSSGVKPRRRSWNPRDGNSYLKTYPETEGHSCDIPSMCAFLWGS